MVRTAYSLQDLTLDGGVIIDLRRGSGLQDEDWWFNIYVMLSRARRLENIILLGFTPQVKELLKRGPPPRLLQIMRQLRDKAKKTMSGLWK